jgi:four helix bundle protein
MSYFEDLKVWQRSVDLAVKVYEVTKEEPFNKDFGLKDQIRRATVSISSNIAEGDQLGSDKAAIRHFNIAKGSTAELYTQSIIAEKVGYLASEDYQYLISETKEILAMLTNLIKHRKTTS